MGEEEVRVLIVDDDPDAAATLAMILEMDGYVVETASDGQDAICKSQAFQPVCVLLDMNMPRIGGRECCRQLRELFGGGLILIAVTGEGASEDRISESFSQFDHYLRKPVDLVVLRKILPPVK